MKRSILSAMAIPLLLGAGPTAAAASGIELTTVAETEIKVVDAAGREQIERVAATKIVPGDEVIYTVHFTNRGSEATADVVITNPVPTHMLVRQIDTGQHGAQIAVSVDGGHRYGSPQQLTITEPDGRTRPVEPSDYTHVRWTLVAPLAPGEKGSVSFRAQLQ